MKQILVSDSFQWAKQLFPILKQFENDGVSFYAVVASNADIKNRNGRVYTSQELVGAAASLSERPLNINHDPKRKLPFPENQVIAARFESGCVECIIQVADEQVNAMISSSEINHVSIEGVYLDESKNTSDTEYPTSLHFTALALLTKDDEPGDSMARILRDHRNVNMLIPAKIQSRLIMNEKVNETKISSAEWSASYINDLDDDAFAYVEPGGHKDEQNKTVPRSLRHLPYKNVNGEIDKPHLRNALARLSQTSLPGPAKAAARKRLVAAAKQAGMETSMDESLFNFKQAYENWRIACEFHRSLLDDMDMDSDADRDPITNPQKKHPAVSESPQDYDARSAVQLDPSFHGVGNPDSTKKPNMTYGLEVNPLAITNDGLTVTQAPNLYTALTNAATNVAVAKSPVVESAPKVTNYKIKVKVTK